MTELQRIRAFSVRLPGLAIIMALSPILVENTHPSKNTGTYFGSVMIHECDFYTR
jgi:hypothetical protein